MKRGELKLVAIRKIECRCGCGTLIDPKDREGRPHVFVSGHNGRKYDEPGQYKREWNHRNRPQRQRYKKEYGRRRKIRLIGLLGGECVKCGLKYNGSNAALFDAHHKDPSDKELSLSMISIMNNSWDKVLKEIPKCELLCSNCHRLEHFEGW